MFLRNGVIEALGLTSATGGRLRGSDGVFSVSSGGWEF